MCYTWTDLTSLVHDVLQHLFGLWELVRVPSEIALAICVLDVQPDEVIWDVMLIEALVHCLHIILVIVVPATLVVGQRSQGREGLGAWCVKMRRKKNTAETKAEKNTS